MAGCQRESGTQGALSVTLPPDDAVILATDEPTTVPPTRTPTITPTLTVTPEPTATFTPSPTPIIQQLDHYVLARPIGQGDVDYFDRTYTYGDTQQGTLQVHHGVDFENPRGTAVLAAADGVVVYAGDDLERVFGPAPDYYGMLVVIEHDLLAPEGKPVYTLYGHLDAITVQSGDPVETWDRIGVVGSTGVAFGPHLHFEVRVGDSEDFGATRNPDLWLMPYPSFGTLAGRVMDVDGNLLQGETVIVRRLDTGTTRYAYTYASDAVNSSAAWGENFTLGDLPSGTYEVAFSNDYGLHYRGNVNVPANGTAWVEIQLQR